MENASQDFERSERFYGNQTDRFQTFSRTHHINQEPRVLWIILGEEKRSRKSPSFSCLGKASGSSGISLPLILATLARLLLASDTRPFFRSHRTDSGVMLKRSKEKKNPKQKIKMQNEDTTRASVEGYETGGFCCVQMIAFVR